ncbi:hypothetical protein EVAR_92896_1 [Eumeta japonica]|uniref:Uncharacterized protein n=1 Tax=Eumeta variegata TaxID=151549 RepID=A0A4C1TCS3_EUMVA|nr:hypothetical protein EVAR_92896_1 [Eumeta japonica]
MDSSEHGKWWLDEGQSSEPVVKRGRSEPKSRYNEYFREMRSSAMVTSFSFSKYLPAVRPKSIYLWSGGGSVVAVGEYTKQPKQQIEKMNVVHADRAAGERSNKENIDVRNQVRTRARRFERCHFCGRRAERLHCTLSGLFRVATSPRPPLRRLQIAHHHSPSYLQVHKLVFVRDCVLSQSWRAELAARDPGPTYIVAERCALRMHLRNLYILHIVMSLERKITLDRSSPEHPLVIAALRIIVASAPRALQIGPPPAQTAAHPPIYPFNHLPIRHPPIQPSDHPSTYFESTRPPCAHSDHLVIRPVIRQEELLWPL